MSAGPRRHRVLVVDDSAFARKVVREVLSADPLLEVVDIARDGLEALERISELRPDVVTLDLVMPNLDGIGVLRALPEVGAPRVVVVSITGVHTELALAALEHGAFDLVQKPTALATDRLYELGAELRKKVLEAAAAPRSSAASPPPELPAARIVPTTPRLVVIGASTGGPPALARLCAELPEDLEAAVAIAVHLPAEYTEAFARRLDQLSPLRVREAEDGMLLEPGTIVVAPGGQHLHVRARRGPGVAEVLVARIDAQPIEASHRPSVDVLFGSAARAAGAATLGVVLTGMGSDGLAGAAAIRAAGGRVLTESESSCVVYGMPRCVVEAGLSDAHAPIERMAELLLAQVRGAGRG